MTKSRKIIIAVTVLIVFSCTLVAIIPSFMTLSCGALRVCSDFKNLDTAIKMYRLDHGFLPNKLNELVENDKREYLHELPLDRWGNMYGYYLDADIANVKYILVSYGADGKFGGLDVNEDINSNGSYCQ